MTTAALARRRTTMGLLPPPSSWSTRSYDQYGCGGSSMLRSEEKERQRQEARAQRERSSRATAHHHAPTAADKSGNGGGQEEEEEEAAAAIFGVVQVAPNPNNEDHRQISDILGDFRQVYRHRTDLIGVDHQPPTPAPPAVADHHHHLHDPDAYTSYPPPMDLQHHHQPPPPPPSSSTYAHRHHGSSRPHKQPPQQQQHHHHHHPPPPHPPSSSSSSAALYKTASNNNNNNNHHNHHNHLKKKFTEGVKSGPGPGPGPGGPGGGRVGVPPPARGRPPRAKDPQVQKIMSEMSDLKSPVSAILPTPRPDHQSSFTFPPPPPTGGLIRGAPPSHEQQQHYHSKTGKSSDSRPSSFIASKSLENDKSSHVLSEESEGENDCGPRVPEKHEPNGGTNGILRQDHLASKGPPVSPFKNTDDSSNSDDSSGSDSESSSSEDEGKQSPAPASPPASDKNPWSLENIFQQSNHKEESLLHEVGSTSKSLSMELATKDSHASSPLTIDEPAPPVVTTVPDLTFTKLPSDVARSKGTLRPPVCSRSSLDDSSDEERPPPLPKQKSKKSASGGSSSRPKQISPSKISKIVEPNLSSESDDEKDPPPPPPPVSKMSRSTVNEQQQQPHSKSPGRAQANKHHHHHVSRKTPKKRETTTRRRETEGISADREKSSERNFAVEEDEGDDESSDDLHRSSSSTGNAAKFSSKKASASMRSSSLHSRKLPNAEAVSTAPSPPPSKQSHSKSVSQHHSTTTGPAAAGDSRKRGGASHKESKRGGGGDVGKRVKDLEEEEEHIGTGKKQQQTSVLGGESRRSAPVQQSSEPMPSARKKKDDAASKRRKRNECRTSEESNSVIERGEELDERGLRPPSSAATTITTTTSYKQSNTKVSLLNSVSYEGGVPKIVCEIPFKLIDRLPIINNTNSVKGVCAKDEKVNKEVLEMRTSGDVLKDKSSSNNSISSNSISNNNNNMNSKSPPNEDATKLKQKAICSIYRKRQSSLEPDKVKREAVSDSSLEVQQQQQQQGARSPHLPLKIELGHVKQESSSKSLVKEETKSSLQKITTDGPLKRHGSSSSLSSLGTGSSLGSHSYSKRHKKDKRKEKEGSSKEEGKKNVKSESTKRRRHGTSPEPESAPPKKSRDSGRESSSSSSTSKGIPGVTPKKRKSSSIPSRSPAKEAMGSPPQRGARNATASEERPSSLPTSEASIVSNQRNRTPHSISSQEKVVESNTTNGGDISEYHSLPSSEHGSSSVYRNGEEHSSPPLELGSGPQQHLGGILDCSGQMYPPSPRPSTVEGNNALILNRESTTSSENPVYFSYFERKIPEILKDNTQYLITAKELKHQADKERHRIFQTIIYLEAVLYFILTGESMESDPNTYVPSYTMYNDTFKLIRHVSSPIFKGPGLFDKTLGLKDNSYYKNVILAILSLRCQSLLALKLIYMKRKEMKEVQHIVCDFLKVNVTPVAGRHPTSSLPASTPSVSSGAGGGTPSGVAWGGSQRSAANNSPPSSLSPTPSPAGSVGSEGSQSSSGYSTEGTRQRAQHPPMGATPPQATGMISIPPDIYPFLIRHCQLSFDLHSSHEMWRDADDLVYMHDMKEFFIDLDHKMGPLTFHSSLRELVNYVQTALDKLKK